MNALARKVVNLLRISGLITSEAEMLTKQHLKKILKV